MDNPKLLYMASPYMGNNLNPLSIEVNVIEAKYEMRIILRNKNFDSYVVISPVIMYDRFGLYIDNKPEFWYEYTLRLLSRCDALCFHQGWEVSKGVIGEVQFAIDHDMPIYYKGKLISFEVAQRMLDENDITK